MALRTHGLKHLENGGGGPRHVRPCSYISCNTMRSHFGTLQRVSQLDLRIAAVATMSNLVFMV